MKTLGSLITEPTFVMLHHMVHLQMGRIFQALFMEIAGCVHGDLTQLFKPSVGAYLWCTLDMVGLHFSVYLQWDLTRRCNLCVLWVLVMCALNGGLILEVVFHIVVET